MADRHDHVLTAGGRRSVRRARSRRAHAALSLAVVGSLASFALQAAAAGPTASSAPPSASASAAAEETSPIAIIGPVLTTSTGKTPELRRVAPTDPVATRAREVTAALKDAAQDLGLSLDLTAQLADDGERDLDLLKRAGAGTWVISPRLEPNGTDAFVLRIVAVPPKSATMLVRVEKVDGPHVSARAVVMLRDFVSLRLGASPQPVTAENAEPRPEDEAARSRGRPILAASSTLFGLYAAFSVHRSSQSDDPRLLYPLLALGSGVGLGVSLLVADEWNVTPADAWTIAGGTWWGVAAGLNIAAGRDVQPTDDRYGWGLVGGLAGTTLAVTAVALHRHDDGDAALVHSGAGLGMFTGGVIEGIYCGRVGGCESHNGTPTTGLGYGAAFGLVGGTVLAAVADTSAQRVLFVDLGAGLGALAGASLGSPLVFREKTEPKQRAFLGAVLAGTAIGSTVAWLVTREAPTPPTPPKPTARSNWTVEPQGGVVGLSQGPNGALLPVFGVGATGSF